MSYFADPQSREQFLSGVRNFYLWLGLRAIRVNVPLESLHAFREHQERTRNVSLGTYP